MLTTIYFVFEIIFFFSYGASGGADVPITICSKTLQGAQGPIQRPTIISCIDLDSACSSIFALEQAGAPNTLRDQVDP